MFETGVDCYSRWTDNGDVFKDSQTTLTVTIDYCFSVESETLNVTFVVQRNERETINITYILLNLMHSKVCMASLI